MRIVLDTNCLKPIVIPGSFCWNVWTAFISGDYVLCVSNEIIMEYREILSRLYTPEFAEMVLNVITNAENVEYVEPSYRFNLIQQDIEDNKFVDCAICGNATYIVTNDHHFDILKQIDFPKVDVRTLREFMELLFSGETSIC